MPRNGSGTYTKPAGTTATAGARALASAYNTLADDMATEMTDSLSRTGDGAMLAALAMGGFKVTGLGTPAAGTDAVTKTYADGLISGTVAGYARGTASWGGTAAGTADALTVTLSPVPAAYAAGMVVRLIAGATNTGAATLNANALGAIALRKPDGATALTAGDIIAGNLIEAVYETTGPIFRLIRRETLPTTQKITATGTWTRPAGCKKVRVRGVGGGAGGGGADSVSAGSETAAGGGGGGEYFEKLLDVSAIASVAVTIGAAGAAGSAAGGNGTDGGTTSFAAHASGGGGAGGLGTGSAAASDTEAAGGNGGSGGAGSDFNVLGQPGQSGLASDGINKNKGGVGGSSVLGLGGTNPTHSGTGTTAGSVGSGYGAGGGGARSAATAGALGAAGTAGVVLVEEYY